MTTRRGKSIIMIMVRCTRGRPSGATPYMRVERVRYRNNPTLTCALMADGAANEAGLFWAALRSAGIWADLQKLGVPPEYADYANLGTGQLPGLRVVGSWLAGAHHMRWRTFLLWNALGGIAWATSVGIAAGLGVTLAPAASTTPVRSGRFVMSPSTNTPWSPMRRRASRSSAFGSKTDGSRRLLRLRIGGSSPSAFVIGDLLRLTNTAGPPAPADTAPCRRNRTHSNRPAWV